IESVLLCTIAGTGGVLAARALLRGYLGWLVVDLPAWVNLDLDQCFAAGFIAVMALAALGCALLPMRVASRRGDLRGTLAGAAARFAGLRLLVVGETAFAI